MLLLGMYTDVLSRSPRVGGAPTIRPSRSQFITPRTRIMFRVSHHILYHVSCTKPCLISYHVPDATRQPSTFGVDRWHTPLARIGTHPPLGELVDALLGGGTSGLDHVEDALFVRHEAGHFAHNLPHHLHALAQSLMLRAAGVGWGGG